MKGFLEFKQMKFAKLSAMTNGWFIGDFEPSLHKSSDFEIAVQRFVAGELAEWHVHRVATEYTVIVSGQAKINAEMVAEGDIFIIAPGEGAEFYAITDVITVVVKTPSVRGDKYLKSHQPC
jgi:hypothetical protein